MIYNYDEVPSNNVCHLSRLANIKIICYAAMATISAKKDEQTKL